MASKTFCNPISSAAVRLKDFEKVYLGIEDSLLSVIL